MAQWLLDWSSAPLSIITELLWLILKRRLLNPMSYQWKGVEYVPCRLLVAPAPWLSVNLNADSHTALLCPQFACVSRSTHRIKVTSCRCPPSEHSPTSYSLTPFSIWWWSTSSDEWVLYGWPQLVCIAVKFETLNHTKPSHWFNMNMI